MAFQIKNSLGESINMHELDKEAAAFWNRPISTREYAYPLSSTTNWFDSIGGAIHQPENYTTGWNDIKCTLWTIQVREYYKHIQKTDHIRANEELLDDLQGTKDFLKPYFDLIDYWESKSYTPHQVA